MNRAAGEPDRAFLRLFLERYDQAGGLTGEGISYIIV